MAHYASCLADDARERMQDLHCWAEAIYQSPIAIEVLSESIFSLLKYPKDGIRRIQEFELHGRGMLSEVYSGLFGIVMQRLVINWKLEVGYRVEDMTLMCRAFV